MYGHLESGYASRSFMFIGAGQLLLPVITSSDDFEDGATVGLLPIFDCSATRDRRCTYEYSISHYSIAIFHLPAQRRGVDCARLDLYGKPYSSTSRGPQNALDVPFYANPRYQLLAFRLWMIKSNDVWSHYTLFVSTETIRRLAREFTLKSDSTQRVVHLAWEHWAQETRMVPEIRQMHHAHISQMRCLTLEKPVGQSGRSAKEVYCLYEFPSILSIRRDLARREAASTAPDDNSSVISSKPGANIPVYVTHPSVIDHPDVWAKKIETALPFKKTLTTMTVEKHDGWQINEDCVIIRRRHPK